MKRIFIAFAIFAMSSGLAYADDSCSTKAADNGTDTKVLSAEGVYLGYVSPNNDGSFFMWLEGKGAVNESAASYYDAVGFVCAAAKNEE